MTQIDFSTVRILPEGFTVRPAQMADIQPAVELLNACSNAVTGENVESLDTLKSFWEMPGIDMHTDTLVIIDEQGNLAGYADVEDMAAPHVHLYCYAAVRPDLWGRGLGSTLADWMVQAAQPHISKAPQEARVTLTQMIPAQHDRAREILLSRGFKHIRSSYTMRIDMPEEPAPLPVPEGITIRPLDMETEFEQAVRCIRLAFRDHFGFVEEPFEESLKRWRHFVGSNPHFDPSIWYVALDGAEIAGTAYCANFIVEDPEMSWVNSLGVRREWRGRGIANALLNTAFREFYRRGKRK
ncbi:MAG: GNAT family N-acetyltransferase, partial [Anaerolineae bacterium]|nr:GNAT family N-acetyltransferase [Anaerolineae bacterium]